MKLALSVAVLGTLALGGHWLSREESPTAWTGEDVYVAEGCVHCHSQYSRPSALDTELYGPSTKVYSVAGRRVLIGNRRQGPDLDNVGRRRSRAWNRVHLIDPSEVTPGSRMPSYAHLFEGDGRRGEVLLDYLDTLVSPDGEDWMARRESWSAEGLVGEPERGEALFGRLCVQCHGAGEGGALAGLFSPPPTRLDGESYRFVPLALPERTRRELLGRVVKYGISGTAMPGHEYLTDGQIADLVSYLIRLPEPRDL